MARTDALALVLLAAGLTGACRAASEPPPAPAARAKPAAPAAVAAPPIAWASAPDCQAKLQLLEQAVQAGRLSASERPPIAVVLPGDPGGWDWLAVPSVEIAADLPLEVHQRDAAHAVEAPCLLMVEQPRDQRSGHRLIGRETVRSFLQSGVRSERNPEYDAAQLRLRKAERAAKDDGLGILKVGDPMLDLVGLMIDGLVSGFTQGRGEGDVEEAMEALIATPRTLDHPQYRAYEFEQMAVLAGKEATIPIALLDRASDRAWRAELRQREKRELTIVEGLDPRDRDYEAHSASSMTRNEFERWLAAPPRLELSAITVALRGAAPASAPGGATVAARAAPPADVALLGPALEALPPARLPPAAGPTSSLPAAAAERSAWPAAARDVRFEHAVRDRALAPGRRSAELDAALTLPPRSAAGADAGADEPPPPDPSLAASVVAILADGRAGAGVYLREDLVLTTAQLVERASVVDVTAVDGTRVLGLVARADAARNLALVQVSRRGLPAALHDGPAPARGTVVEAIVPTAGGKLTRAAGRYLGDGPVVGLVPPTSADLAYLGAPTLQEPPEAAPWFLGDRLVGLGVAGPADAPSDAPHHAIRAAEIAEFLADAGGLAALR